MPIIIINYKKGKVQKSESSPILSTYTNSSSQGGYHQLLGEGGGGEESLTIIGMFT